MLYEENLDSEPGTSAHKVVPEETLGYNSDMPPLEEIPPIDVLFKQEREKKEISQKDLAKAGEITNVQVSRIERGESNPSVRTLVHLAPYLGYSLEDLLIASHYQGTLPTDKPTYIDLDGKVIDLEQAVKTMYRIDGELLLLIISLYKDYTISDGKMLKIILKCIAECRSAESNNPNISAEKGPDNKAKSNHLFIDAFSNLKQFIFSFDRLAHGTAN